MSNKTQSSTDICTAWT